MILRNITLFFVNALNNHCCNVISKCIFRFSKPICAEYSDIVLSQIRASPHLIMDSHNRLDYDERIRNSAVNTLDSWVNASGPTIVHEGSFTSTVAK